MNVLARWSEYLVDLGADRIAAPAVGPPFEQVHHIERTQPAVTNSRTSLSGFAPLVRVRSPTRGAAEWSVHRGAALVVELGFDQG